MYKYTVLFFLAYSQGMLCWNTHRVLNSLGDSDPYHESTPIHDAQSVPDIWTYRNNKEIHFTDEIPRNDYNSRITFPEDNNDYPSNKEHIDKNTHVQRFILKCIRSCPLTNDFQPVCGSDDITYYNIELLRCVRGCGDDVEVRHLSSCTDITETSTRPTSTKDNIELCVSSCPATSEYNPVCGTDNVTYKNIGKLSCAQACGVDVEVKRQLPCPKKLEDLISTESPIETTTINNHYFHSCMDSCVTTTEYKPVCASNGKTYFNTGKFECAKNCGLNISIQGLGVCQINQSGESDTSTTTTTVTPDEIPNKQSANTLQNLLDKIFSNDDTGDPKLDVRHS